LEGSIPSPLRNGKYLLSRAFPTAAVGSPRSSRYRSSGLETAPHR
jgi:hypothetical protein